MAVKYPSKLLHRHTLPLVVVGLGFLLVSTLTITHYQDSSILRRSLVTRLHLKPATNGLAQIDPAVHGPEALSTPKDLSQAGQAASLTFSLQTNEQ